MAFYNCYIFVLFLGRLNQSKKMNEGSARHVLNETV